MLIGILAETAIGLLVGEASWQGAVSAVPSMAPTLAVAVLAVLFVVNIVFLGI